MKEIRCPNCQSYEFMIDATVTDRLPVGFGFADNSGKFQIDMIQRKGYHGYCMNCQKENIVYYSRKHITRKPKSINNKLKLARRK